MAFNDPEVRDALNELAAAARQTVEDLQAVADAVQKVIDAWNAEDVPPDAPPA